MSDDSVWVPGGNERVAERGEIMSDRIDPDMMHHWICDECEPGCMVFCQGFIGRCIKHSVGRTPVWSLRPFIVRGENEVNPEWAKLEEEGYRIIEFEIDINRRPDGITGNVEEITKLLGGFKLNPFRSGMLIRPQKLGYLEFDVMSDGKTLVCKGKVAVSDWRKLIEAGFIKEE